MLSHGADMEQGYGKEDGLKAIHNVGCLGYAPLIRVFLEHHQRVNSIPFDRMILTKNGTNNDLPTTASQNG
jgi:hypothetical protein